MGIIATGTVRSTVYYNDGSTNDDALKSGTINDNQKSCFQVDLSVGSGQAGEISFYWKVSSELNGDHLKFYVDNVLIREISGDVDWSQVEYTLGSSSSYELKWCYDKNAANAAGQDRAWVDLFTFASVTPISPEDALDNSLQSITNAAPDPDTASATTAWITQDSFSQNGGDAMQSGLIGDAQKSCFETSLTAPKEISFYWKVSSEENADYLKFYVDDTEIENISGNVDWSQVEYTIEDSKPSCSQMVL